MRTNQIFDFLSLLPSIFFGSPEECNPEVWNVLVAQWVLGGFLGVFLFVLLFFGGFFVIWKWRAVIHFAEFLPFYLWPTSVMFEPFLIKCDRRSDKQQFKFLQFLWKQLGRRKAPANTQAQQGEKLHLELPFCRDKIKSVVKIKSLLVLVLVQYFVFFFHFLPDFCLGYSDNSVSPVPSLGVWKARRETCPSALLVIKELG